MSGRWGCNLIAEYTYIYLVYTYKYSIICQKMTAVKPQSAAHYVLPNKAYVDYSRCTAVHVQKHLHQHFYLAALHQVASHRQVGTFGWGLEGTWMGSDVDMQ